MNIPSLAGVNRSYKGRLDRGETGVTLDTVATVLALLSVTLRVFRPSNEVYSPKNATGGAADEVRAKLAHAGISLVLRLFNP